MKNAVSEVPACAAIDGFEHGRNGRTPSESSRDLIKSGLTKPLPCVKQTDLLHEGPQQLLNSRESHEGEHAIFVLPVGNVPHRFQELWTEPRPHFGLDRSI